MTTTTANDYASAGVLLVLVPTDDNDCPIFREWDEMEHAALYLHPATSAVGTYDDHLRAGRITATSSDLVPVLPIVHSGV